MNQSQTLCKNRIAGSGQRGALTIFTAVLVLILMTLMLVYATRVSLFETRVSGNEVRQKEAFHVAEAAVDQGIMFLLSNASLVLSSRVDVFPDGFGFDRDGWFAVGNVRWEPCTSTHIADEKHPCGGGVAAETNSYFYDTDGDAGTFESLAVNTTDFPAGTTARMSALLCFVDLSDPAACTGSAPTTGVEEAEASMVLTLLAYGYSDCTVPLVTKSTLPVTGTVEVVGNPNGGGLGVPLTTWINNNPACSPGTPITSSGSWQTCEMQEWYKTEEYPEGVIGTCPGSCQCGDGNDTDYFLSWRKSTTNINIDIIVDPNFPCDLFEFYFGVQRSMYTVIKNQSKLYSDCTDLGPQSSGLIWISGDVCRINADTIVGSPENPVILISAATDTILAGGATIFGVLYVFDGEDINAELTTLGNATVYGAAIVDAVFDNVGGTFSIVHADGVLANAAGISGLGSVNGGWRDFGLPDIAWPDASP